MDTDHTHYEIDERFIDEWVAFGMTEMNAYLKKHARFAEYCDRRDASPRG